MIDKDTQDFLKTIKEPEFSSYDFLILFSATLLNMGINSFNRDTLLVLIREEDFLLSSYRKILRNIEFKNNGIFAYSYSPSLEEAYSKLKWSNVLYTISPEEDGTIYIKENIDLVNIISKRQKYYKCMKKFVDEYIKKYCKNDSKLKLAK